MYLEKLISTHPKFQRTLSYFITALDMFTTMPPPSQSVMAFWDRFCSAEASNIIFERGGSIFIPIHMLREEHWTLAVLNIEERELWNVYFWDSFGKVTNYNYCTKLLSYWFEHYLASEKAIKVRFYNCTNGTRHQTYDIDCGAFVCYYAKLICEGLSHHSILNHKNCTVSFMKTFRKAISLELYGSDKLDVQDKVVRS